MCAFETAPKDPPATNVWAKQFIEQEGMLPAKPDTKTHYVRYVPIPVLSFCWDKPFDDTAMAVISGLKPSSVRVRRPRRDSNEPLVTGRVTVWLFADMSTILYIEQEIEMVWPKSAVIERRAPYYGHAKRCEELRLAAWRLFKVRPKMQAVSVLDTYGYPLRDAPPILVICEEGAPDLSMAVPTTVSGGTVFLAVSPASYANCKMGDLDLGRGYLGMEWTRETVLLRVKGA